MTEPMPSSESPGPASDGQRPARWPWQRAVGLALAVLYGPQLAMCFYTLFWVGCGHCKRTVWVVVPMAPGLFLHEWTRQVAGLPHSSSAAGIAASIGLSAVVVGGLTAWLRCAGRWRMPLGFLVALAAAALAAALLAAVRS